MNDDEDYNCRVVQFLTDFLTSIIHICLNCRYGCCYVKKIYHCALSLNFTLMLRQIQQDRLKCSRALNICVFFNVFLMNIIIFQPTDHLKLTVSLACHSLLHKLKSWLPVYHVWGQIWFWPVTLKSWWFCYRASYFLFLLAHWARAWARHPPAWPGKPLKTSKISKPQKTCPGQAKCESWFSEGKAWI